jgi:hypothetical protein
MSHIQKGRSKKRLLLTRDSFHVRGAAKGVFTKGSEPLLSFGLLVAAARMIESSPHFFFGYISGFSASVTEFPLYFTKTPLF